MWSRHPTASLVVYDMQKKNSLHQSTANCAVKENLPYIEIWQAGVNLTFVKNGSLTMINTFAQQKLS